MPRWVSTLFQLGAILAQVVDWAGWMFPQKYRQPISLAIGCFQAAVGYLSHNYNPDGTPAAMAYRPK